MSIRNEIKAQIVRAGFTMQELVDRLADEYDWSDSVSNLSTSSCMVKPARTICALISFLMFISFLLTFSNGNSEADALFGKPTSLYGVNLD